MSVRRQERLVKLGSGPVERWYERRKIGCTQAQATARDAARPTGDSWPVARGLSVVKLGGGRSQKGCNDHYRDIGGKISVRRQERLVKSGSGYKKSF